VEAESEGRERGDESELSGGDWGRAGIRQASSPPLHLCTSAPLRSSSSSPASKPRVECSVEIVRDSKRNTNFC
jgi:hypothetical protein